MGTWLLSYANVNYNWLYATAIPKLKIVYLSIATALAKQKLWTNEKSSQMTAKASDMPARVVRPCILQMNGAPSHLAAKALM